MTGGLCGLVDVSVEVIVVWLFGNFLQRGGSKFIAQGIEYIILGLKKKWGMNANMKSDKRSLL